MPVQLNPSSAPPISAPQAVRSMAAVADPRQDSSARLEQMAVGKFLNAQVMDRLSSGSWLVRVTQPATTPFAQAVQTGVEVHMQLPAGIQLGDKLELTLLAREPRLTFGIGYPNPATTTTLSPTARLIDQLLHQAEQAQQPHHVVGQAALLPDQAATQEPVAPQLANQLQQALERSGLFYESHLRQWANGERSLAQIRQEPQNQTDSPQASGLQASAQVPLQLDTLEQRHFAWQGELWPGQPLQWEVSKDGRGNGNGSAEPGVAAAAWNTVLKLELPELGPVDVRIRLQGQRVQLQVRAEREVAITTLHAERQRLDDALAATGTALDGFMVQRDAHA
ncbi:flagellar hook-length control protein FliK [Malikia sp.]|uniref:flagellar hook-length control protein FliK n=1 Tax=Malikia sp. TaxID=2070706 RepID=UPI002603616E|nr:flagellar hook-length control protein FliK [Malikia sp.]MDD2727886.1 flagellar hook-length control protein FliK [Malikia sp.]